MEEPNTCPLEFLLGKISGQWTLYILWTLKVSGEMRFGELRLNVGGISSKVLTERLRLLESIGMIDRRHEPTIPPQVSYSLTATGAELAESLEPLYDFAAKWSGN